MPYLLTVLFSSFKNASRAEVRTTRHVTLEAAVKAGMQSMNEGLAISFTITKLED